MWVAYLLLCTDLSGKESPRREAAILNRERETRRSVNVNAATVCSCKLHFCFLIVYNKLTILRVLGGENELGGGGSKLCRVPVVILAKS